jgi:hypothetical protein
MYAAHLGGIDKLENGTLTALEIADAGELEFTVLRKGPDGIWSFAGKTIGVIGPEGWRTVAPV